MKKSLLVVVMLIFVMAFTVGVLADNGNGNGDTTFCEFVPEDYWLEHEYDQYYVMDPDESDGLDWKNNHGSEYVLLPDINRNWGELYKDSNRLGGKGGDGGADIDQELLIRLPAFAYIPCYIEMTLTGNELQNIGKTFGPDTYLLDDKLLDNADVNMSNILLFDNQVGGFVNQDWDSRGSGKNAEVEPDDDLFIAGCDIFCVRIDSNEDYKYQVWSKALEATMGDDTLDLYMISKVNDGSWTGDFIFDDDGDYEFGETGKFYDVKTFNNLLGPNRFLHNFKVPYTMSTKHGEYTGEVIFRAVSI